MEKFFKALQSASLYAMLEGNKKIKQGFNTVMTKSAEKVNY